MKNQKGITLIALVVTIIVLLILAGVTIALLTGDNGILTNTNNAKKQTQRQQAIEEINIALNSIKTEVLSQINKDSAYNPNNHCDLNDSNAPTDTSLLRDALTGLSDIKNYKKVAAAGDTTGYYINYASNVVTISYSNKENHFTVSGTISFASYSNGGSITGASSNG